MKLSELLYEGEYKSRYSPEAIEITRIVSDTRALEPHCLFICLKGARFDTHTLIERIGEAGASAILAEQDALIPEGITVPVFLVESTRRALSFAFSRFYGCPEKQLTMIGVTGTNGKTSTATILASILTNAGYPTGLIGTAECVYNGSLYTLPREKDGDTRLRTMTTPDPDILYPILRKMVDEGVTHVVMEVSSHSLALEKVSPIRYRVGIFTNISPEHMDFHGTMERYLEAKAALFRQCEVGICNADNEYAAALIARSTCNIRTAGVAFAADVRATDIRLLGAKGILYCYTAPGMRLRVRSSLPGSFSVYNSLLALTAAIELSVPPLTAAEALVRPIAVPGRLERVELGRDYGFSVFIDYAHTEAALRALLVTVRAFCTEGERIVLLFGCGGDRDKTKRAPMGRVAEELADRVIVTSDNSRTEDPQAIIDDILSGMRDKNTATVIKSRRRAITEAILGARPGDIILLCGKGHETYEIGPAGVRHFDEREIVKSALEKRKNGDTENEN